MEKYLIIYKHQKTATAEKERKKKMILKTMLDFLNDAVTVNVINTEYESLIFDTCERIKAYDSVDAELHNILTHKRVYEIDNNDNIIILKVN